MVMGTYAYMPPEQARGERSRLDERADVFALGAILAKILTGQAAYKGDRLWQMARDGALQDCFARLDDSGADPELIGLAKSCLASSPAARSSNAQAVLDGLRCHFANAEARAREDRERRIAAETKAAEERKRQRVMVALAASVVAVLLVGGAGLWTWQEQRSLRQAEKEFQARQNRASAENTLAGLDGLYARFLWDEAERQLAGAEALLGPDGDAALRERITEARRNTALLQRLDQIRLDKAVWAEGKLDVASALRDYPAAFAKHGYDVLGGELAAVAAALQGSPVWPYLLAALDDWALTPGAPSEDLVAVTAAATSQRWRARLSEAGKDGARLAVLYDAIPAGERTPAVIYCRRHAPGGVEQGGARGYYGGGRPCRPGVALTGVAVRRDWSDGGRAAAVPE
jgi:hypothetical protein